MLDLDTAIAHLSDITQAITRGDPLAAGRLDTLTARDDVPESVIRLAEHINFVVVQKEIREFRLEAMIEELLEAQASLEQARHDPLTSLPNRAMFHELLHQACLDSDRGGLATALLFIDLDRFKQVNDTMGHDAGDDLLKQVADRLSTCIRANDVVARLGGDEFTAVLRGLPARDLAEEIAARIVETIGRPFDLAAGPATIGASIGLSFYPDDADRATALLKNADVAMYQAKESGRNGYRVYQPAR